MFNKQYGIALELIQEYHAEQMYGDKPYVYHLAGVAKLVLDGGGNVIDQTVALLHDILEDTPCTPHKLRVAGLCEEVVEAVMAITHYEMQNRNTYLRQCCANPIAKRVKKCDTLFNLTHSVQAGNSKRIIKYAKQLQFLEEYKSKKGVK